MNVHFLGRRHISGEQSSPIIFLGGYPGVRSVFQGNGWYPRGDYASSNTDILRELLANNTTHFSRVYIKQYWHFHRIPYKLNYSKNIFRVHITLISYQIILTYSEFISNSIHTFTELLPNSSKYFFESFNGHLKRQIILKEEISN